MEAKMVQMMQTVQKVKEMHLWRQKRRQKWRWVPNRRVL